MINPLISVVIPTYNCSRYILSAVKSVTDQTYGKWEIIVIDDGSTDDTEKRIKHLSQLVRNIRYYKQDNQGQASARLRGLYLAKGDYIAFLDADDSWEPPKLEKQLTLIYKKGCEACFTDINILDKDDNKIPWERPASLTLHRGKITRQLFYDNFIAFSSVLVLKEKLWEVRGSNPAIQKADDWDLLLRLSTCCFFDYVDERLTNYRVSRPGQISGDIDGRLRSVNKIANDFIKAYPGIIPRNEIRRARAHRYRTAAYNLQRNETLKAVYYSFMSLYYDPFSIKTIKTITRSLFHLFK